MSKLIEALQHFESAPSALHLVCSTMGIQLTEDPYSLPEGECDAKVEELISNATTIEKLAIAEELLAIALENR